MDGIFLDVKQADSVAFLHDQAAPRREGASFVEWSPSPSRQAPETDTVLAPVASPSVVVALRAHAQYGNRPPPISVEN